MSETFSTADLLEFLRRSKLATVSTLAADGSPQSALVGIGVTGDLQIVFDTASTTRKHANLLRDPRISVVVGGPGEKTLQYEGVAKAVSVTAEADAPIREAYFRTWPDGRERLAWPNLAYWRIAPTWARYTDYDRGPLIAHFFEGEGRAPAG